MPTKEDLQEFNRNNRDAVQLAEKAEEDYLLARSGIQQGLFSAFEVATQGLEKLLKAYLLFRDHGLGGSADKVRKAVEKKAKDLGRKKEQGHDVEAAFELSAVWNLSSSSDLRVRLSRINSYYARRYPGGGGPTSLGSSELRDVDEAVFEVWDAFEAVNSDYYHVCGLMMPIYAHFLHNKQNPFATHFFNIMTSHNESWKKRRCRLELGIEERISLWYPGRSLLAG